MVFSSALLGVKSTRTTQGVGVLSLKKKFTLDRVCLSSASGISNFARYRVRSLPAAGALVREEDSEEQQMTLI